MAAAWPASLPQRPLKSSYRETLPASLESAVDDGPPKRRRMFTAGIIQTTLSFKMTTAQLDTFRTFYDTTLAGGSLPFDFKHVSVTAEPTVTYQFAGSSGPAIAPAGPDRWIVSLNLVILP